VRQNCRGLLYIDYVADHEHTQRELAAILETRIAHYQDVVGSCLRAVSVKDFYQDLYNIGLCFGETFRNVTRMLSGPEQCAFEITVGDPGETFSSGQLDRPHLIHPTTLDALFQALAGALYTAGGGLAITKTIIPTFIAELEISYDIPAEVGTCFKGYGESRKHGFRDVVANIFLFDKSAAAMYVAIQGFRCTEMSGLEGEWETASSETQSTGLCSKISWEHAIDLMTPEEIERIVGGAGCGESLAKVPIAPFWFSCTNIS
jgi:zearalenone synthase (highly reducing iterative type I polyketide synthase)